MPSRLPISADEIEQAVKACDRETLAAPSSRATGSRTPRQLPKDERFTDALGVELELALERDQIGRPLCSRRHRRLSVICADERGAGEGGGVSRVVMVVPIAW